MRVRDHSHFAAGGPVGRYWLAHGEGFAVVRVDGRRLGVVDEVVAAADGQSARRLVVRRRGLVPGRYAELEAGAVVTVLPRSRVFVVCAPEADRRPDRAAAGTALRRIEPPLRSASDRVRRAANGLATAAAAATAALRPRLSRLGHGIASVSRAGARRAVGGAGVAAGAAAAIARRTRHEIPVLAAAVSARTRAGGRSAVALAHEFRRHAARSARAAGGAAQRAGRLVGDLVVAAAVVVAEAWRAASAAWEAQAQARNAPPPAPDPGPRERVDSDEPLARDPGKPDARLPQSRPRASAGAPEASEPRPRRRTAS